MIERLTPFHEARRHLVVAGMRTIDSLVPPGASRVVPPLGFVSWRAYADSLAKEMRPADLWLLLGKGCSTLNSTIGAAKGEYRAALERIHRPADELKHALE